MSILKGKNIVIIGDREVFTPAIEECASAEAIYYFLPQNALSEQRLVLWTQKAKREKILQFGPKT